MMAFVAAAVSVVLFSSAYLINLSSAALSTMTLGNRSAETSCPGTYDPENAFISSNETRLTN